MEHTIEDYGFRGRNDKYLVVIPPKNADGTEEDDVPKQYLQFNSFKKRVVEDGAYSEITITFNEKVYRTFKNQYIIQAVRKWAKRRKDIELLLIPDYGETFRMHFHGWVKGSPDKISNLVKSSKRMWGRTECRYITCNETYFDYVFGIYTEGYVHPHKKFMDIELDKACVIDTGDVMRGLDLIHYREK